MKRVLFLLLTVVALMAIVFSATAATTTEEKSRQYQAAISELEAYLESYGNEGNLYGIQSVFESLGGFEKSKWLYYYTTVLVKLSEETYDFDLLSALELMDSDQRFQDYLNDALRGSPLCSVEELKTYAEGREKENNADPEGAMDCYKNCMSYFDASERYKELRGNKYQHIYDQAMEMQNAGDLAGAYFLFSEIAPFEQSEDRKTVIEKLLGYTPESPTDNLLPVTEALVTSVQQTEVVLSWSASKHAKIYEVQYKQGGTDNWTSLGETDSTTYTVSGLAANTTYDFRIIAAIGKIRAEGAIVSVDTAIDKIPDQEPNTEGEGVSQSIPVLSQLFSSVSAKLITHNGRWDSKLGPGYDYASAGGYKTDSQHTNQLTLFYIENGWIYADIVYSTDFERYAYLPQDAVSVSDNIPQISTLDAFDGVITKDTIPSWGPNDSFTRNNNCSISANTIVRVFFQENDYVYAEFSCEKGTVRMWLPIENVSFENNVLR